MTAKKTYTRPDTILAVAGRDPDNNFGIVNPPVYHASTILSPTMAKFENRIPPSPARSSASSRPATTSC